MTARSALHALLAVPAAAVLWAVSAPGGSFLVLLAAAAVLLVAGLVWTVWVVRLALRRRWTPWVLVAPLGCCLVVGLVAAAVPLRLRWAVSEDAFTTQAQRWATTPVLAEPALLDVPDRLGLYGVTAAYRVPGGVVFHEATGSFIDDAGFAYLPAGPTSELENTAFENPEFRHLGGAWYAWTASW